MSNTDKLLDLVKRLNNGENPKSLKAEAQAYLATLSVDELSFAEEKLVAAGMAVEDLRHLCSIHMEMLKGEVTKMLEGLEIGHPMLTLVKEHDILSNMLDDLEELNTSIQKETSYNSDNEIYEKIGKIANDLLDSEPHHQREEEALFPVVEAKGVFGPTRVMTMEHVDLRKYKQKIKDVVDNVSSMDFDEFKKSISSSIKILIMTLRDHIFKENNILYPMAMKVIVDKSDWQLIKEKSDKIGYCSITPKEYY